MVADKGSPKAEEASSNEMPCFFGLPWPFPCPIEKPRPLFQALSSLVYVSFHYENAIMPLLANQSWMAARDYALRKIASKAHQNRQVDWPDKEVRLQTTRKEQPNIEFTCRPVRRQMPVVQGSATKVPDGLLAVKCNDLLACPRLLFQGGTIPFAIPA